MQKAAHLYSRMPLLKDGRQHPFDLVARKRHELDLPGGPLAVELREPTSQRGMYLIGAVSRQEQQRLRRGTARQVVEKIQASTAWRK